MSGVSYRLYFGNQPASAEQLEKVDSLEVSQVMDAAWQAKLKIPVCLDQNGHWSDESDTFMNAFSRVRVEIDPGNGTFVPLIDGVVVSRQPSRDQKPGASEVTLVVNDDSVHLNQVAEVLRHENLSDSEIAEDIYTKCREIASVDIDDLPIPANGSRLHEEVQRETPMAYLQSLARRNQMHAYVLPGTSPGESIGVFKRLQPRADPGLPPLLLPGPKSNIDRSSEEFNALAPTQVVGRTLRICDKTEIATVGTFADQRTFGDEDGLGPAQATELLAPGTGGSAALSDRARARAGASRWANTLRGTVRPGCYSAALQPYKAVEVRLGASSSSGTYTIRQVTHKIDRGSYQQSFAVVTDGFSSVGSSSSIPAVV